MNYRKYSIIGFEMLLSVRIENDKIMDSIIMLCLLKGLFVLLWSLL